MAGRARRGGTFESMVLTAQTFEVADKPLIYPSRVGSRGLKVRKWCWTNPRDARAACAIVRSETAWEALGGRDFGGNVANRCDAFRRPGRTRVSIHQLARHSSPIGIAAAVIPFVRLR